MKRILLAVLATVGLGLLAAACGSAAADVEKYKVEIGESASSAQKAQSHDITKEALKEGRTEFTVQASDKASYKITLTKEQIQDLLGGTTIIVDTQQGGMKVKIGPDENQTKKKKSGW